MKIEIFYFTGTGNTKYVCDELCNELNELSLQCSAHIIDNMLMSAAIDKINQCDIVIIAYPIYSSDVPDNMLRFIENMPNVTDKKLGVIVTQYLLSGDGGCIMSKTYRSKGYNQMWSYQINMPNNLCIKGSPLHQSNDYEYHEKKRLAKARAKVKGIAQDIINDKRHVKDNTIFHKLIALTQRPIFRNGYKEKIKKSFSVDHDKCINCEMCVASCPNNVIKSVDGKITYVDTDACTTCFRCMNFCIKDAILYNGGYKLPLYKGPTKSIYNELFKKPE